MLQKSRIEKCLDGLLASANAKNTKQGRLVCLRALESLSNAESEAEVLAILRLVNGAYLGIEAHGHLAQHEFSMVQELRDLEGACK